MTTKYRVWNIVNVDREGFGKETIYLYVPSPKDGAIAINILAQFELQFPERLIGSNVFGLECREYNDEHKDWDGDWIEWEDDDGNDIMDLADQLSEQIP